MAFAFAFWGIAADSAGAQSKGIDRGYESIVFATRNIAAGSVLVDIADIGRVEARSESWQSRERSPSSILGCRITRDLHKNEVVLLSDVAHPPGVRVLSRERPAKPDDLFQIVYVKRDMPAGTVIKSPADFDIVLMANSNYPLSVYSPREVLGRKVKRSLRKNQAIGYADIDFQPLIEGRTVAQILHLSEQLGIARTRWSSLSDDYWESYGPHHPDSRSRGAVIVAARSIKKGDFILNADALEMVVVAQSQIPAGAIANPLRAIGSKAKYDIAKNTIVSIQDLDLCSPLSKQQKLMVKAKLRSAAQKWTGFSADDFMKRDRLLKL